MKKNIGKNFLWLLILAIGTIFIIRKNSDATYTKVQGGIFGTLYSVIYQSNENLKSEIETELNRFDYSLSPFKEQSIISKVNRNEPVELDSLFINVFNRAQEISAITDGAFDITVAPLVNAWGFGFKQGVFPDSIKVDSLLQHIGFNKIKLIEGKVVKENPEIILDCSAIAKGYAVDVIGDYLESKGIKNYMVDIGGEVLAKGVNPDGKDWSIGLNKPIDDETSQNNEIELVIKLRNKALATSGNYRNYYIKDGQKYAHTINPKTGFPIQHNILSATVLANDCMTADALATSFMVVGLDKSLEILSKIDGVDACLIYTDEKGGYQTYFTEGIKEFIRN